MIHQLKSGVNIKVRSPAGRAPTFLISIVGVRPAGDFCIKVPDEADGFASCNLAMGGSEFSGVVEQRRWPCRIYGEIAGTSCGVLSNALYDCAYHLRSEC